MSPPVPRPPWSSDRAVRAAELTWPADKRTGGGSLWSRSQRVSTTICETLTLPLTVTPSISPLPWCGTGRRGKTDIIRAGLPPPHQPPVPLRLPSNHCSGKPSARLPTREHVWNIKTDRLLGAGLRRVGPSSEVTPRWAPLTFGTSLSVENFTPSLPRPPVPPPPSTPPHSPASHERGAGSLDASITARQGDDIMAHWQGYLSRDGEFFSRANRDK